MTIGVVYGGTAEERGASEKNARDIAAVLSERGYHALLFETGRDILQRLKSTGVDFVYVCVQGKGYGDGTFQEMLDNEGIPYTGSGAKSARLINDKILCKVYFDIFNIRTPEWDVLEKKNYDNGKYAYEEFGKAPNASPEKLLENLRKDIDKFVGTAPQFDDITMLGFRFYGDGTDDHAEDGGMV